MPDIFMMLRTIDSSLIYLIDILRWALIGVAAFWAFFAIMNLHSVATGGQGSKFLPSNAQPTAAGSFIQLFIAGVLGSLAMTFTPITVISAMLNDNMQNIQMYTVQSYSGTPTPDELQELLKRLIHQVFFIMGFLAIYRGLSGIYHKNQGTRQEANGRIITWLVLGTLSFFVEQVNALFASGIGFNVFKIVFGV